MAGGLVEGAALGVLQGRALAQRWPTLSQPCYALATLAVAGVGWAVASAPSVLHTDDNGADPPLALMLLGAAGMGLAMGPVLGAAQAMSLRTAVARPWRWVAANAVGWPPAMMVIFLGASTAGSGWSTPVVTAYGALTGAFAGTALGLVTGLWLRSLEALTVAVRTEYPVGPGGWSR